MHATLAVGKRSRARAPRTVEAASAIPGLWATISAISAFVATPRATSSHVDPGAS